MAVEVLHDQEKDVACLTCTTTGRAFGPTFPGPAAGAKAESFLEWLGNDPRSMSTVLLETMVRKWEEDGRPDLSALPIW